VAKGKQFCIKHIHNKAVTKMQHQHLNTDLLVGSTVVNQASSLLVTNGLRVKPDLSKNKNKNKTRKLDQNINQI